MGKQEKSGQGLRVEADVSVSASALGLGECRHSGVLGVGYGELSVVAGDLLRKCEIILK